MTALSECANVLTTRVHVAPSDAQRESTQQAEVPLCSFPTSVVVNAEVAAALRDKVPVPVMAPPRIIFERHRVLTPGPRRSIE